MGSFRPGAGNQHLHWYFNFTGCIVETVLKSLRLSCGSELPDKEFRYLRTVIVTAAVYWGLNSELRCLTPPLNLPAPGRRQPIYLTFRFP